VACDVTVPDTYAACHIASTSSAPGVAARGAPDPDPSGTNVSGSGLDPDPAGSEVGSGKYWPDPHNYGIKHHSTLSFQEMTHDNTELSTKTQ